MGLFSNTVPCENIGSRLAHQCIEKLKTIPRDENPKAQNELIMICMCACHTAVNQHLNGDKMKRVIESFYNDMNTAVKLRDFFDVYMKREVARVSKPFTSQF